MSEEKKSKRRSQIKALKKGLSDLSNIHSKDDGQALLDATISFNFETRKKCMENPILGSIIYWRILHL